MTSVGTPRERTEKPYATGPGAKKWLRTKLGEHKEWADTFNHDLADEIAAVSKEIDELNFAALPPNDRRSWSATDDYSGFTFVVEVWTENT
jgi:hypothetical protein